MLIFVLFAALILLTLVFYSILSRQDKEKTEFFHVMAHRFRSPISIVKWYVELLSDKSIGGLNDKQKQYLDEIYRSSERLNDTIDSLIVLLQLQSNNLIIKIEKTDVKNIISQIIQKLQFRIDRRKLNLKEIYPKEQETLIQTDPKLLSIVIQNLIENCIRYTPEGGNIDIKVDFSDNRLSLEIKDNGYGIPKEKKSKILAASVNSKDMGFSLYLVKSILKKLQAQINFKSEENKGTTFFISLPV